MVAALGPMEDGRPFGYQTVGGSLGRLPEIHRQGIREIAGVDTIHDRTEFLVPHVTTISLAGEDVQ